MMCIECGYIGEIEEILKDEDLANYEMLEKIFKLKTKYEKKVENFLNEEEICENNVK